MTTPNVTGERGGDRGVVGWVALAAHVAVGMFPYGASGLVAPAWGLGVLVVVWLALLVVVVRWRPATRWWLLVVPVAAIAAWVLILSAGEAWFGWTA